ncbi:DegT/DnrJ/EryC1/StrS family aminotransferase [Priestia koreensis]|uniref:DegT/DnrJ/EryC1/StrS family aminotransferase n=1 Tax=Priestia koreensis TaxID=284581 RepID=UPI003CFECD6B
MKKINLYEVDMDHKEIEAVTQVISDGWLSTGPHTKEFEELFSKKLQLNTTGVAVNSGTAALHTAMYALGITEGDEVLVPSMTFVASASTVKMVGATPKFVDSVSLSNFGMDPKDIIRKITPRTKAIVVVHYGGYSADMKEIIEIAREYNLKIIEDVAHGPFVKTNLGMLGTLGDVGCFSFFATKNLSLGEGGMVVSRDGAILEKARLFRSHHMGVSSWDKHEGRISSYDISGIGMNYRLTEIQAVLGKIQMQKIDASQKKREKLVEVYRNELKETELVLPYLNVEVQQSSHHIFPVILPEGVDRSEIIKSLAVAGIQTSVHYPPCHLFTYYRETFQTYVGQCPVAESIGERELSLPMHSQLSVEQVQYICSEFKSILTGEKYAHRI